MVHALQETWRVLRATGILVDLRPRHANQLIELITDGQSALVACYDDDHRVSNDVASDQAIAQVVDARLFRPERSVAFEYVKQYDTGTELMEYFLTRDPPVHHPDEIVEQIYQADTDPNTTLRFTNDMQLRCYHKIDP